MRLQARGKLHSTNYMPGDLYLSDFLYETEMESFLELSDVVPITDDQAIEMCCAAVTDYRSTVASYQERLIELAIPVLDKIFLKFCPHSSDMMYREEESDEDYDDMETEE